jgi:putative membrane protein
MDEQETDASEGAESGTTTDLRLVAALIRTAFSSEQSLMSWIRTSVSLITFGFSITQFFHYLEQQKAGTQLSEDPRRLGLALLCVGVLVLVAAVVEHVRRLYAMRQYGLPSIARFLLPVGSAGAVLAIGIAALAIAFRT